MPDVLVISPALPAELSNDLVLCGLCNKFKTNYLFTTYYIDADDDQAVIDMINKEDFKCTFTEYEQIPLPEVLKLFVIESAYKYVESPIVSHFEFPDKLHLCVYCSAGLLDMISADYGGEKKLVYRRVVKCLPSKNGYIRIWLVKPYNRFRA